MRFISYLETKGLGADRFEHSKPITSYDLMPQIMINEEDELVRLEGLPNVTLKMMFNEYKSAPYKFIWSLIKTPFRAVLWFIRNVFMRLLVLSIQGALLTVLYQAAIGETFSEAKIFSQFWKIIVLWIVILGLIKTIYWIISLQFRPNYIPGWTHELWVPPFIVLWELNNGELIAHHYLADMQKLSSDQFSEFANMAYADRFILGNINDLIDIQWPSTAMVLDEDEEAIGEHYPEGPDMLYLTELSLATYDMNNLDPRVRLEKQRLTYQNETTM